MNKSFIKSIKEAVPKHCSNCGAKYREEDLTLIQKNDYAAVFHLTCNSCRESYLINVVSPLGILQGASRVPLKIDLSSAEEAKKFMTEKSVSSDDVLNIHEMLKNIKSGDELYKILKMESTSI